MLGAAQFAATLQVVASGASKFGAALLAGDGLAGALQSIFAALRIDPPFPVTYPSWWW